MLKQLVLQTDSQTLVAKLDKEDLEFTGPDWNWDLHSEAYLPWVASYRQLFYLG